MKSSNIKYIISTVSLLVLVFIIHAQRKDELIRDKEKALDEIEVTNKLLQENEKNKQAGYTKLLLVNKRVELRSDLVESLRKEIQDIEFIIEEKNNAISLLQADLKKIKKEYERVIYHMYTNKIENNIFHFVLAGKDINSIYKRIRYYQAYSSFRKEQIKLIKAVEKTLVENVLDLEESKKEREGLLSVRETELLELEKEKLESTKLVKRLKRDEIKLKKTLRAKQKLADQIENEIRKILKEEAEKYGKYGVLTPELKLLSDNFSDNKGRMPWPTSYGVITEKFGTHDHPVLKGTKVENNGIDITTVEKSEARCIFEGTITKIISILGANYIVIVRHGNFLSLYQNIGKVKVKVGDNVTVKQSLGTIYTNPTSGETKLHFEIWKEFEKQNPELWLSK